MERVKIETTDEFEVVTVFGAMCLFTEARVDKNTLPDGLYAYEVRETEGFSGVPGSIEGDVIVNFYGTLISLDRLIPEGETVRNFTIKDYEDSRFAEEWNYEGNVVTLAEFMKLDADKPPKRHMLIWSDGIEMDYHIYLNFEEAHAAMEKAYEKGKDACEYNDDISYCGESQAELQTEENHEIWQIACVD